MTLSRLGLKALNHWRLFLIFLQGFLRKRHQKRFVHFVLECQKDSDQGDMRDSMDHNIMEVARIIVTSRQGSDGLGGTP